MRSSVRSVDRTPQSLWFAWYPVQAYLSEADSRAVVAQWRWVWLEHVHRRVGSNGPETWWIYSLPEKQS